MIPIKPPSSKLRSAWSTQSRSYWFDDLNEDVILDFNEIYIKSTIQYLIDKEMLKIIDATRHHFIQKMDRFSMNPNKTFYDFVQAEINEFFKIKNIKIGYYLNVNLDIIPIDNYHNELSIRIDLHINCYETKCYASKITIPNSCVFPLPLP